MEERSRDHFTMLRCVIHHQCNAERSGAEMEEKMFRCLIHHQCDIVKSIPLRSVGTVNVAMILVRSGAERGNIEWLEKLQCSHHCQKHSAPLR